MGMARAKLGSVPCGSELPLQASPSGFQIQANCVYSVGKFVVATLQHPKESSGKALKVQSFIVSPNEVVAEYEKQTGAKWFVISTPLDEIKALEAKFWEEGNPRATGITLRRIWGEGGTLYAKNDNEVLGLGPEDLDSLELGVKRGLSNAWQTTDAF